MKENEVQLILTVAKAEAACQALQAIAQDIATQVNQQLKSRADEIATQSDLPKGANGDQPPVEM